MTAASETRAGYGGSGAREKLGQIRWRPGERGENLHELRSDQLTTTTTKPSQLFASSTVSDLFTSRGFG